MNWYNSRSFKLPNVTLFRTPSVKNFKEILFYIKPLFDLIFIDGKPSDIAFNNAILESSDILLIPTLPSLSDLKVTEDFIKNIQLENRKYANLISIRCILNKATNTNISKEALVNLSTL